ncbi:putative membrane protein [Aequitasia blattaphilus]
MTNVLLFTYVSGLIPLTLIKMKNDVGLFTIIRLQSYSWQSAGKEVPFP